MKQFLSYFWHYITVGLNDELGLWNELSKMTIEWNILLVQFRKLSYDSNQQWYACMNYEVFMWWWIFKNLVVNKLQQQQQNMPPLLLFNVHTTLKNLFCKFFFEKFFVCF